jgi:hypothetical protein
MKFPLWQNPSWVIEGTTQLNTAMNEASFEYFDNEGNLIGLVQAYGAIWNAFAYTTNGTGLGRTHLGCYYFKQQAMDRIERMVHPEKKKVTNYK